MLPHDLGGADGGRADEEDPQEAFLVAMPPEM